MKGITKRFPGVLANDHIDLEIKAGEIHAILGENGAGKSTLMKILNGEYQPDEGEIYVRGEKVSIKSPLDAIGLGIGMVHQHLQLVPAHTVIENIVLGHRRGEGILDLEEAKKEVKELAEEYDFELDLDAKLWQLSAAKQQTVEILRSLYRGAKILILDEPTSALAPVEEEKFLSSIKNMAREGNAVIPFITHKLPKVLEISDRVTILRSGKVVDRLVTKEATEEKLARKMIGKPVVFDFERPETEIGEEILRVENLSARDDRGVQTLNGVSFSVREGELFAIVGVSGNGQQELAETLMGLRKPVDGKVFLMGEDITKSSVRDHWKKGMGYIPVDREEEGYFEDKPLWENFAMNLYWLDDYLRKGKLMDKEKICKHTEEACQNYNIKTPSINTKAGSLSGGNLQKLIVARVMEYGSDLLIANLPTRGLDVEAANFVANKLLDAKEEGVGIILISEKIDEALSLADRVAPIYEGEFPEILSREEADRDRVGAMMGGIRDEEGKN
ncbi:hypothetical protein AKJ62_03335 [candidate division MSBL1 archaeon SCGC-AAA259D14]|uniref:ABC transporter domain-containing protein n=1 Tax=candidate division MSBL1 archaeon SCGC-AAA259D14 TaxID=1698261 RepID=A0A133U580_9EURY|nr:hypothetical protein AKJ62_03335 [candidate division MSBL1 archaeon SCGC-AAA259D14]